MTKTKKMMIQIRIMISLGWANRKLIWEGIMHSVKARIWPSRYHWVRERKRMCDSCAFNTANDVMPNPMPWRWDRFCIACKCNLHLKQHSPNSSCGLAEIENGVPKWGPHI